MRRSLLLLSLVSLPLWGCADESDETDKSTDDGGTTDGATESEDDGTPTGGDDGGGEDESSDDGGGDGSDDGGGDGSDGGDDGGSGDDDVPLSVDDAFTAAGCELLETEPVTLAMGASLSEANTAVIVPDDETTWLLQMPETGDGWFTVEVPDWMTVVHFFTDEGVELEIMGGESFSEVLRNGSCPDAGISHQRWAFHDWGAYTIRVAEGAPAEVWFTLVKEG
jgi:hypothetical protein